MSKRKPTSKDRELQSAWNALCKTHAKPLERGASAKGLAPQPATPHQLPAPYQRRTDRPQSLSTPGGSTAQPQKVCYTGSTMLGIGQMHKSNAVPVFSTQDARDLSTMRRN